MTDRLRRAVARLRWDVLAIVVFAFAARLVYRLAQGEAAFLENGYTFYRDIAESFLAGQGLCFDDGVDCAVRLPVYPILVSFFVQGDFLYPGLPLVQATISATRCLLAYGIGRTLFGPRAGLVAAGLTAINPYSIVHSTAMQDTSLFNMLMALSIYLLLQSREPHARSGLSLAAGAALAVASLTTVRLGLFLPMAVLWAAMPSGSSAPWRVRQAALVSIPIVVLLGVWVGRNWIAVGAPVLTTEAGVSLWLANNPDTLEFLPDRSVDELSEVAHERLPADRRVLLASLDSEVAVDRLLGQWAIEYMWANPGPTLANMGSKVAAAFSGQLSPARGGWVQLAYAAFIVPLHALALFGWWRTRGRSDLAHHGHLLVCFLFAAFAITTAVFWAHTSHKSTLHLFLAVYAAFAITQWLPRPGMPAEALALSRTWGASLALGVWLGRFAPIAGLAAFAARGGRDEDGRPASGATGPHCAA